MGLLINIVNASSHTKYVSLSNQKCEIQPTLIILHLNEYSQEFHYYSFSFILDGCFGSCNDLIDLSNNVCIPNKTEVLNISIFSMIAGIYKSKILTKYFLCECKCRFDRKKCNLNQ